MIGLWKGDLRWAELLRQEGVSARAGCRADVRLPLLTILDAAPDRDEARRLASHVEDGGLLLTDAGKVGALWPGPAPRRCRLRYIVPSDDALFAGCTVTHVESAGWVLKQADAGRDDRGRPAVARIARGTGLALVLPFDPALALARFGTANRQFVAASARLPYETVSVADRGGVRRIVANCLRVLLASRGLPYVHLSYVPDPERGLFGFRVDTDESTAAGIESAAGMLRSIGVRATWFLNTGELGADGIDELVRGNLRGEDVQLHCFDHEVYHSTARDRRNIQAGLKLLRQSGIAARGYAAPFGEWGRRFAAALDACGLMYSSEFAFSYDDLPSYPVVSGRRLSTLQVPVHPMCAGRLRWARATDADTAAYFARVARLQRSRMEPCFLYDHPADIVPDRKRFRRELAEAVQACGVTTTMTEYADWWQRRDRVEWSAHTDTDSVLIAAERPQPGQVVVIELGGRYSTAPLRGGRLSLRSAQWREREPGPGWTEVGAAIPTGRLRLAASTAARALRKSLHRRGPRL